MNVEDLMKPRYKVIADYPSNTYGIGEIISIFQGVDDDESIFKNEKFFLKYPHLFRKLEWWEDRDEKDMPEYIKFYEPLPIKFSIWKVNEWRFGLKHPLIKTDCDIVWRELSIMDLPSTLEEYTQYTNKQKQ